MATNPIGKGTKTIGINMNLKMAAELERRANSMHISKSKYCKIILQQWIESGKKMDFVEVAVGVDSIGGGNIMKMSTKGRLAVGIVMSVAHHQHNGPIPKKIIAVDLGISADYVEQIAVLLRKAGIVAGIRGVKGGYLLAKVPLDITVFDILCAVDGEKYVINCKCTECRKGGTCVSSAVWEEASQVLKEFFEPITLQDLLDRPEA